MYLELSPANYILQDAHNYNKGFDHDIPCRVENMALSLYGPVIVPQRNPTIPIFAYFFKKKF